MVISRREILTAGGSLAAAGQQQRRPNLLFVVADEFRGDAMSCAGHRVVKTPVLDRLASRGLRFTRHFTCSPLCTPARHSLFSGLYAHQHGAIGNGQSVRSGTPSLPGILREAGYHTALAGKLHFSEQDSKGLFDWTRRTEGGRYAGGHRAYLRRVMPQFQGDPETAIVPGAGKGLPDVTWPYGASPIPDEHSETAWIADRAIEYINSRRHSSQPWFCFLSFLKPHSEFVIPEPWASRYKPADMRLPDLTIPPPAGVPDNNGRMRISDPRILREIMARYFGAVSMVDHHLGRVIDTLDNSGFGDNTVVIFTSDHGNMLGEHQRLFKVVMYEASIHVPLLIRAPRLRPGVSHNPADSTAVQPLVLGHLGLPAPAPAATAATAYASLGQRMVRTDRWKLFGPEWELYDLRNDPGEKINLIGKGVRQQPELEKMLADWWQRTGGAA